ncbi:MAG: hypothetical protein QXG40_00355 [Ignisphaera sp.]
MGITVVDYSVIVLYIAFVIGIAFWSWRRTRDSETYFTARWNVPWWLAAVSHHMSGYSAFAFVAYAGVAWRYGFTIYTIWALTIGLGLIVTAFTFAPRWAALAKAKIQSPLEWLEQRYNLPSRLAIAASSIGIKFIDEALKVYSLAVFLSVFWGMDIAISIGIAGALTLFYMVIGGLLADILSDFLQAIVQFLVTMVSLFVALQVVGGLGGLISKAPPGFWQPLSGPYDFPYWIVFLVVVTLSYAGGTLGLAQRFIATGKPAEARKAALFSAFLYLVYPLTFFIPMWATRILYPDIKNPDYAYATFAKDYLPTVAPGLLGLMAVAMFAATMSMVDSDLNALSAIATRDLYARFKKAVDPIKQLRFGRVMTLLFGGLTVALAFIAPSLGPAFSVMVTWYAGLLGPVAVPLLLGLMYGRTTWRGALASWAGGFIVWAVLNFIVRTPWTITTGAQLLTSFGLFFLESLVTKPGPEEKERIDNLFKILKS